jgi:sucrose phosphorylase
MSTESSHLSRRITEHLVCIYPGENHQQLAAEYLALRGLTDQCASPLSHYNNWNETDNILITYGDSLIDDGELPLTTLKKFVDKQLKGVISGVHILPFFPWSSDDGFSVMDYLSVNPALGGWDEIGAIANDYDLMADLVINHMSSRSRWFDNFKKRIDPGKDYFFEASPEDDLSEVVRPRNSPLLTEYDTADGKRHVWCTFSADQVDLNFGNPQVLGEFINIIRHYLQWGVKIFRLDAVAFLWKQVGTPSIHRQQTHEIIKLLRTLIEHHSPKAIIITETNVPNRENLTYFGNANEAHIVYNFSLPPMLLYTLTSGNCQHLKTWMMSMPPAQSGTAYLNFVASHDGIGLRPLDGLIDDHDRTKLVNAMTAAGGKVTYRKSREGEEKAYEINIALYSALKGTLENADDGFQRERFICAHGIMLALEGIPALYIHSLLGTENDYQKVEHTGRTRSINRHVWHSENLERELADKNSHHSMVFSELKRLLSIRKKQPAFHPNATQFTLHLGFEVFAFWRQSINRSQSIFSLSNVTSVKQVINLADINLINTDHWIDLITEKHYDSLDGQLVLAPYQTVWISNR